MTASKNLARSPKKSKEQADDDSRFSLTLLTKDHVLGAQYHLSLVVVGDARSKQLNFEYRKKTYIPNVLSFPLDVESGEIFLNLKQARREHKQRGESFEYFVALLFIHSMLHLIGKRHGSTMEEMEQKVLRRFQIRNIF
jgi:probable rRNA maturation factor